MTIHTLELATTAERAFAAFAAIGAWWHTTSSSITIKPRVDGRVVAYGRDDEWGEVTRWDPPRALAFGAIEVVFVSTGDRTIVRFDDGGLPDLNWPARLARFAAYARR